MKTLLVCIDFSDKNEKLLAQAKKLATSFKERIVLLHICQPNPEFLGYDAGPGFFVQMMEDVYKAQSESLTKMADKLAKDGFTVQPLFITGPTAAKGILEQAQKLHADMILMGTHGHGQLYNLLLGSVAEEVLRQAPCPVLMLPMKE